MSILGSLAASARVPVYGLAGERGREMLHAFQLDDRVRVVASPRHASVLLVAGTLPASLHVSARRVHDQLPEPRGVLQWTNEGNDSPFSEAVSVTSREEALQAAVAMQRALMDGSRASSKTFGPRHNPIEWRGVGPHGQGGEGMMGGKPYGRPMAMTGADVRDGLRLDRLTLTLGPFLPLLPPGLRLSVELQGDVVQSVTAGEPAMRRRDVPDIFLHAVNEEVRVANIEMARARHHLAVTADLLRVLGLGGLARRVLRLAAEVQPGQHARIRVLARTLHRNLSLRWATRGVGRMPAETLAGTGPVGRAAGIEEDARLGDPAYRALDFAPLTHAAGDAEARWQQRLAEAAQSLELAAHAGDARRAPDAPLEDPRGPFSWDAGPPLLKAMAKAAPGQAWDAFVTTLVSLDLEHTCRV